MFRLSGRIIASCGWAAAPLHTRWSSILGLVDRRRFESIPMRVAAMHWRRGSTVSWRKIFSTGMFSAWRFDGRRAVPLWSSDLLQQSSYEADGDGFHLTYCAEPDEDHPAQCLKMTRDLYRLQAGDWKRIETKDFGVVKATPK